MAISAVSSALSRFNQCEADEQVEELVTELTWMQCFLVDGKKTAQGQVTTDVWSSAIERLAGCAQEVQYGKSRDIANLNSRFASLRAKIQPFLTCCGSEIQIPKEIMVVAWGGSGSGSTWVFKPKGLIKKITIAHGDIIDSLTFTAESAEGILEAPIRFGGPGGRNIIQVNINSPAEYLKGISGTHGPDNVRSIRFETNLATYGPYGSNDMTPFSVMLQQGKIVGFHGRANNYINTIGLYVTPM